MSFTNPTAGLTELIEHSHFLASQPALRRSTVAAIRAGAGFTIVELLIVIVVIGILAAIVIVAFNGVQNRANDTAVTSDLAAISKKLEIYKATAGTYPTNETELEAAAFKVTQKSYQIRNNLYYCRSNDGQHFAMGAYSISGSRYWVVDGTVTKTTDNVYGDGTCSKLDPHAHPVGVNAYGYHDDTNDWRDWTE